MLGDPSPHVTGETLGDAFMSQLSRVVNRDLPHSHMTVAVRSPVDGLDPPETCDIREWEPCLNLGWQYGPFSQVDFGKSSKTGDSDGGAWLTDRLIELLDGMYWDRMMEPTNQLEMVKERLEVGLHGSCTNGLVIPVSGQTDLERATEPVPNNKGISCVTQLQFRPRRDQLDLFQVMRSQYVDLKGYGNLAAAAALLTRVCDATGYAPGVVVEHVNNAILYDRNLAVRIYGAVNDD